MNALDVIRYGHGTVLAAVQNVPEVNLLDSGVCGAWSTRDILAHLASYELVLADILLTLTGGGPTPGLEAFLSLRGDFNDSEVEKRQHQSGAESLAEYSRAYDRVNALSDQIPEERWRETGAIPWYGSEYSLDDLIAYQYYGHKREHCAQIAGFTDHLGKAVTA